MVAVSEAEAIKREVLEVEAQRSAAMVAGDVAALNRIFADEFNYIHSTGRVESRADFLAGLTPGRYVSIDTTELDVRPYGTTSLVSGVTRLTLQNTSFSMRYLAVYVNRDGRWQLVALEPTRLPEPAS